MDIETVRERLNEGEFLGAKIGNGGVILTRESTFSGRRFYLVRQSDGPLYPEKGEQFPELEEALRRFDDLRGDNPAKFDMFLA